jgi:RNA polymerase sigma factor (sigma-70 family)
MKSSLTLLGVGGLNKLVTDLPYSFGFGRTDTGGAPIYLKPEKKITVETAQEKINTAPIRDAASAVTQIENILTPDEFVRTALGKTPQVTQQTLADKRFAASFAEAKKTRVSRKPFLPQETIHELYALIRQMRDETDAKLLTLAATTDEPVFKTVAALIQKKSNYYFLDDDYAAALKKLRQVEPSFFRTSLFLQTNAAKTQLWTTYEHLIATVAAQKSRKSGLPFATLTKNGQLGLWDAIERYDHRISDLTFEKFAYTWIEADMQSQIDLIKFPYKFFNGKNRMWSKRIAVLKKENPNITFDDLVADLQTKPKTLRAFLLANATRHSLDQPLTEEPDSAPLSEIVPDTKIDAPEISLSRPELQKLIRDCLTELHLNHREQTILNYRFGLDGHDGDMPRPEIGEMFEVSGERIRQIETQILKRLRAKLEDRDPNLANDID